jgi:hypothetical protein
LKPLETHMRIRHFAAIAVISFFAQTAHAQTAPNAACATCIRSIMENLASDARRGRGSGTEDEHDAANWIGEQLKHYGITPAGDNGTFVQTADIVSVTAATPPVMSFANTQWTHGEQFLAFDMPQQTLSGPLQIMKDASDVIQKGAFVLVPPDANQESMTRALKAGAAMVFMPASAQITQRWDAFAKRLPRIGTSVMGANPRVVLNADAINALKALPTGANITLTAEKTTEQKQRTWNAVGILHGSDPVLSQQVVLLSAHLDHLGIGTPVNGDAIYNGADDDASGTTAVLEMARVLGAGPKPKRTVVFALFGSEEKGGLGSNWFEAHPPMPLTSIVANLEFEMIGRPDAAVQPGELWLTGWDRSNLGPMLAQHGARLVNDPHPDQNFFQRSDNIVLAKKGVVAHTVSSYGLHPQYHHPDDDLAHIDWAHMETAIGSMIAPVQWLVNSDFTPEWLPGKQP